MKPWRKVLVSYDFDCNGWDPGKLCFVSCHWSVVSWIREPPKKQLTTENEQLTIQTPNRKLVFSKAGKVHRAVVVGAKNHGKCVFRTARRSNYWVIHYSSCFCYV